MNERLDIPVHIEMTEDLLKSIEDSSLPEGDKIRIVRATIAGWGTLEKLFQGGGKITNTGRIIEMNSDINENNPVLQLNEIQKILNEERTLSKKIGVDCITVPEKFENYVRYQVSRRGSPQLVFFGQDSLGHEGHRTENRYTEAFAQYIRRVYEEYEVPSNALINPFVATRGFLLQIAATQTPLKE